MASSRPDPLSIPPELMPPKSILDLVEVIKENALALDKQLIINGLPRPCFDAHETATFPSLYSPQEVQDARAALLTATRTLQDLVLGPAALLEDIHVRIITRRAVRIRTERLAAQLCCLHASNSSIPDCLLLSFHRNYFL